MRTQPLSWPTPRKAPRYSFILSTRIERSQQAEKLRAEFLNLFFSLLFILFWWKQFKLSLQCTDLSLKCYLLRQSEGLGNTWTVEIPACTENATLVNKWLCSKQNFFKPESISPMAKDIIFERILCSSFPYVWETTHQQVSSQNNQLA